MDAAFRKNDPMTDREHGLTQAVLRERVRLKNFVRKRVPDPADAEDILQDVLFEFVEAYRLPEPIEQVGAWLFRVARNRIIDRFRKRKEEPLCDRSEEDIEELWFRDALLRTNDGPEAAYARRRLMERVYETLDALPQEQRAVFLAHEIEGRSFRDIANDSGVPVNTLLGRKRYAVLRLRAQLKELQDGLL